MFTNFLCFFLLKLLKLGEIDGVKFLARKSGGVNFWTNSMSASARDSVYIVYRVCKCYQLFENSIKCYQEHLQILASSHIAKDVES